MNVYKFYTLMLVLLVHVGCASQYPLGLSKEQWNAIPPEKQAEYQARQYQIDEEKRKHDAEMRAERERQEVARAEAERERLQKIYDAAEYGDIVRVTIENGYLEYHGTREAYHPVSFELVRGEEKSVPFTQVGRASRTVNFDVKLSQDGNTLYFDGDSRDRIVIVNRDWEKGQLSTSPVVDRRAAVQLVSATFFVKYKELPGAPRRVIIEKR